MVGHAVIVRGRYCTLIKRRKHYERFDIPFRNIIGMTSDEFVQATFRYAMDHPEESEREAKLQQIQKANSLGIRLVKMYPVYQGETEAQALRRAVKEEMQRNEKYTVYRKTDISRQSRDVS